MDTMTCLWILGSQFVSNNQRALSSGCMDSQGFLLTLKMRLYLSPNAEAHDVAMRILLRVQRMLKPEKDVPTILLG